MLQGTKDNENKKRKAEMLQDEDPGSQAPGRDRLGRAAFGKRFYITRFTNNEPSGLHMSCRCAGHVRCTKESAFSVTGSEAATRQFLKAWAIVGEGLQSRSEHMAGSCLDVEQLLVRGLKERLTELQGLHEDQTPNFVFLCEELLNESSPRVQGQSRVREAL